MTQRTITARPSTLLTVAVLILLGALAPRVYAGALPEISDNSGAFTHAIPIPVPDGPAGATPELQLLYSSAGGNGNAGVGWSLPYSAIRLDQSWGVPRYWLDGVDPCDPAQFEGRLWLDGQELIPSRHDPLAPEQCTYRTRPDTFTLIVPIESDVRCTGSDGPDVDLPTGYAVVRNDGSTWWYGATTCDSPYVDRADDGTPTKWLLQHVQDRDGNLVTYWPERGLTQYGPIDAWWAGAYPPFGDNQACDGCLRAVTWAARAKDVTDYAFDATITGSPADDVVIAGAQQPYSAQHAGLTGKFTHFLADPGSFWPSSQSHYYAVKVDWEERPDVRTSFMSGAPERLDRRIRQVAVFANTEVERANNGAVVVQPPQATLRTFRLDYDQGSTGRSRLVRVWPIAGQYAEDADYSSVFGTGFPQTGFDTWEPAQFAANELVPNPWEFVWSDNAALDPDAPTLPDYDVFLPIDGPSTRSHAPVPWMGANWREGGYPTITMVDLNGDALPEIVQHDELLPKYLTAAANLMDLLNPYADVVFGANEPGVASDGQASNHFWVRWNTGDGFTDLEQGPVDPFALQEVADYLPLPDGDFEGQDWDGWIQQPLEDGELDPGIAADMGDFLAAIGSDPICGAWWTGAHSYAGFPFPQPLAAWCEHRSCAPFCEIGTTITSGPYSLATDLSPDVNMTPAQHLDLQTTTPSDGGHELVLWRRYGVTRATSGDAFATLQDVPFNEDPVLGGGLTSLEPRTVTRWVDGYARPSFQTRIASDNVELAQSWGDSGPLTPEQLRTYSVREGLVHDTIDINGDGYPDRVLGGAGVLEHHLPLPPEDELPYTAPSHALFNPSQTASKEEVVSTQHMPWIVALFDPERGEFGEMTPWFLPLTHEWLMGGAEYFPDHDGTEPDPRLFSRDHDYSFLGVWESTARTSGAPVSSGASASAGPTGVSAGMSASIGPVSIGGSISGSGPDLSVGIGPVSFGLNSMSIGPVSIDYGGGVQTGAGAAVAAVWFVIQKALQIMEIPYSFGFSHTPNGVSFSVPGYGTDCLDCQRSGRWQRQGLVDLNGDGLADYVIGRAPEGEQGWTVILNEGDGFADEPIHWTGIATNYLGASVTDIYEDANGVNALPGFRRGHQVAALRDINGDGLPDFVYGGLREVLGSANPGTSCELPPQEAFGPFRGLSWGWLENLDELGNDDVLVTLCAQLNTGSGFGPAVDWFGGSTPSGVVDVADGIAPSLSTTRMLVERSPTYADGFGVGLIGVQDFNGDGLPDLYRMEETAGELENRTPVIYLNDGRKFVATSLGPDQRYGRFTLDTTSMTGQQEVSVNSHHQYFQRPHPMFDINRTHRRPGGNVVQSMFVDLDGDGRLDWAQSDEGYATGDGRRHGVGIRLYPLQETVPDTLVQLWEPGGGTQRMTYRPARDFMDLPHAPNHETLPDGTPLTDDMEDVYPASAQVLSSTIVYDGLGARGSDPVGVVYQYGDPDFAMADPSLTAGDGVMHPSFRRRPMGFARIVAQPCEAVDIDEVGECTERAFEREVTVVQEYGTDWMTAALPWEQRVIDKNGRVRSRQTTHWDAHAFASNYEPDLRPWSVFGQFNWHYAPVLVESEAYDESGNTVRGAVQTAYEIRNGMALCTGTDLDGDDWVDRVEWTEWDTWYIDDGKRDAALMDGVSVLPLGAQNVFDEASCGHRSEVQNNNYAVRRSTYERYPSGRVAMATTYDTATNESLAEQYDYLPNGMPYKTVDPALAEWFTLYDPMVGATPIGELAPPNTVAGVEFLTSREVCGLTTFCEPGAWGQVREETSASGRTATNQYDALGRPIAAWDDVHTETAKMIYSRPIRLVAVDEEPVGLSGGGFPAYVAAMKPVAPGVDVWTHTWTDGLGRTLLVAEDWEDEHGTSGQRVAGGEIRDWRGRVKETPWPCFAPNSPVQSQNDWLSYMPGLGNLGLCASDPPRDALEYDALSRVIAQKRPDGAEIRTTYRHSGGASVADVDLIEGGHVLTRTTTATTPLSKWTVRYDAVTHTHDSGQTLPAGVLPGASELHTVERMDALGRRTVVWRTGQGAEQTTFGFDGFDRLITYSDPDQGNWELDYDPAGRMEARRLVEPISGATEVGMRWDYDEQGRVLTEWSFDDAMAWQNQHPTSWWEWTYDVDPGTQGIPLPGGGEIGQPSEAVRYSDTCGGAPEEALSWRYDRRGRPIEEAFTQKSCHWQFTGAPPTLVANHEWTAGDAKARTWTPWSREEISWDYDAAGRPAAVSDSTGTVAEATYEIQGRLSSLLYSNGVEQSYLYATGNTSTQALTDSIVTDALGVEQFNRHYEWDAAGNLRVWSDQATPGSSAETWDCDYDGIGTLLGCRGSEGEWFEYTYDALGNLIAEDVEVDGESRWASQYARGTGGMHAMPGVTTPLNAPVARVVGPTSTPSPQDPGQSFFYDGRGHMVAQRYHDPVAASGARITTAGLADPGMNLLPFVWERQFDWNASGRLDSVSVHGMTTSQEVSRYWYGPGGNRIAERVTPLASEPDPTWTQSRRWAGIRTVEPELEAPRFVTSITLGSTLVAQKTVEPNPLQPNQSQVTTRWLGGDHLGSASIVTDENGELVRGVRYEPYGRIRDEWGPEADPDDYELAAVDELFNGKPRSRKAFGLSGGDYALEAYDYGARIYLPELSRWASADSITPDTVWSSNHFAYVRNNPLKYVDPDGHWEALADALAGAKTEELYERHSQGSQYISDRRAENIGLGIGAGLGLLAWAPIVHQTLAAWGTASDAAIFGPTIALQIESTIAVNVGLAAAKLRLAAAGTAMAVTLAKYSDAQVYARGLAMSIARTFRDIPHLSKRKTPKVVTVVYDRVNDRVFVGLNGEAMNAAKTDVITELSPELLRRMPEESLEAWPVANCAEVAACNKALVAGSRVEDLDMFTVDVRTMSAKPRCANCVRTTEGVDSRSDVEGAWTD